MTTNTAALRVPTESSEHAPTLVLWLPGPSASSSLLNRFDDSRHSNTSLLYLFLSALTTTITTDIERTTLHRDMPLLLHVLLSGSVLQACGKGFLMTMNDHACWNRYISHTTQLACALLRAFSTTGFFQRHLHYELMMPTRLLCSKACLGRTYTGRSFLEPEQSLEISRRQAVNACSQTSKQKIASGTTYHFGLFMDGESLEENPRRNETATLLSRAKKSSQQQTLFCVRSFSFTTTDDGAAALLVFVMFSSERRWCD